MAENHVVSSATFKFNGSPLYYERRGCGEHFVLLIPGALGSGSLDYPKQHESFDLTKFTLISVDPIGYGKSRPAKRPTSRHFWVDAEAYHQLMTVELSVKHYSIIGFSDGGRTGLIMGAEYPDEVTKIVAFGTSCYVTESEKEKLYASRNLGSWNDTARTNLQKVYGAELGPLWNEFVHLHCEYTDIFKTDLPKITCPVFILHGSDDKIIDVAHAYYFRKHLPNVKVYVHPEGSHYWHVVHASLFNSKVTTFLLEESTLTK